MLHHFTLKPVNIAPNYAKNHSIKIYNILLQNLLVSEGANLDS